MPARYLTLLAIACATVSACGASDSSTPLPDPGPGQVAVRDNRYVPSSITIAAGDHVTFVWQGVNFHSVTFDSPDIPSISPRTSGEVDVTFPAASRTYTYFCSIHGRAVMSGEVIVQPVGPTNRSVGR